MSEESDEDHWDMVERSIRRAGTPDKPDWLHSYHVRRFSTAKRRKFLFSKAEQLAKVGKLRMIFIDGLADYVESINDEKECKWFCDELFAMMDRIKCAVMGSIHVNPSIKPTDKDKGCGWLGTIFEKRASFILLLKKEEDKEGREIFTINTKAARHAKASSPKFVWSNELHRHVRYVGPTDIVTPPKGPGRQPQWTWEKLSSFLTDGMRPVSEWQQSDMVALAQRAGCSADSVRRAAQKHLAEQAGFGLP